MNLSEYDVCQTIAYINNSFHDLAKRCSCSISLFKVNQSISLENLAVLAILFSGEPQILALIKSTQETIKSFQPDGVGRSSAQPSGDVGQEGNL